MRVPFFVNFHLFLFICCSHECIVWVSSIIMPVMKAMVAVSIIMNACCDNNNNNASSNSND